MHDRATRIDLHVDLPRVQLAFECDAPIIALRGPSGCGKTTVLRALAGLARARGTVVIDGVSINLKLPPAARSIGYCPQDALLFPHLDVKANIAFGAAANSRIDQLANALALNELLARMPRSLSGGEQQRVALARALAREPRVLLLDEPFAAQHPEMRLRMVALIQQASRSRCAFVTSHDEANLKALDAYMVQVPQTHA